MKKTICHMFLFIVLFGSVQPLGFALTEAVNGHYDANNDWFVFKWERKSQGTVKTIYDAPNKIAPVIMADVSFSPDSREFAFRYKVGNEPGSKQSLHKIFVKHLTPVYGARSPRPAENWYMDEYKGKDAWHWVNLNEASYGILAGKSQEGFFFRSKGLPAIVKAGFIGYKRAQFSPPGDYDTDEVADSFERVFKGLEEKYKEKFAYVTKKTVGPVAPPAELKPLEFVDTIIKMKHEASSLGWIKNKGIEKSLDAKLDNAKKKLEQGSPRAAGNILTAFINEVEAQGCASYDNCPPGKHLTSEAYALLKYNARYLIDNLK